MLVATPNSTRPFPRQSRWRLALALAWLLCVLPLEAQDLGGNHARTLSGVVTSHSHEPLRGAIVKLQEGDSPAIVTFLTGPDGRYHFLRLSGSADYRVWVTFRDRTTASKEISKFDSHMDKVIDFTVESF